MKIFHGKFGLGIVLLVLSAAFYYLHYLIFHDAHHIFIYLLGDIAFVFIEVLLVSIVIHHLLNEWEKKSRIKKLNMVIETFFSECGKPLLAYLSQSDNNVEQLRKALTVKKGGALDVKKAAAAASSYKCDIDIKRVKLDKLDRFLSSKRGFLINLLQNPNLLEHETFTELLMALFHVTEELSARELVALNREDLMHMKSDIERAYLFLVQQWVAYMKYTHLHYPYFFLFALRTNPFDVNAESL